MEMEARNWDGENLEDEADRLAAAFLRKIESGEVKRDTLPNRGTEYTGPEEEADYCGFQDFRKSELYKHILSH